MRAETNHAKNTHIPTTSPVKALGKNQKEKENMAHVGMEGKDTTLFDVVKELETEIEELMQALEITPTANTLEEKAVEMTQGKTERRVLVAMQRLQVLKRQIAESTRLVNRVISAIGE